jgi:hypothetical protein
MVVCRVNASVCTCFQVPETLAKQIRAGQGISIRGLRREFK